MPHNYSALLDSTTQVLLALSPMPTAIALLAECTPQTSIAASVLIPNYTKPGWFGRSGLFLTRVDPVRYPDFTWNVAHRVFEHSLPGAVTPAIRERSTLAVAKLQLISMMTVRLSSARSKVQSGVILQETVYRHKESQAQKFKDGGYDEDMAMEIPLVVQYADFKGIPLKQAADDILFKVRLDMDILAKTELLRLKYFDKVKGAQTVPEIATIQEDFIRDFHVNARL